MGSLKHMDYWENTGETRETERQENPPEVEALSAEDAVEEVQIALENLWSEKIELSQGCCLWHTPFIRGQVGSLFGIGEGFAKVDI